MMAVAMGMTPTSMRVSKEAKSNHVDQEAQNSYYHDQVWIMDFFRVDEPFYRFYKDGKTESN
jgi:hypothetical protein